MHLATPRFRIQIALFAALTLAAPVAHAAVGDLYVTSDATNKVNNFSGTTGIFQSVFVTSNAALGEMAIHFGASNGRALVGHNGGGVEEFDVSTSSYIKTYNAGGGWQWAGVYGPNGNVYAGDMTTDDVRQYDKTTGAFINVLCSVPDPADMEYGPSGHLYVCSFTGGVVYKVHPVTGAIVGIIVLPPNSQANDVAFNPANSEILVSDMLLNVVYRFSNPGHVLLGSFAGTGWLRPHGIAISPHTGHVMVVDGVTAEVHEFDPLTYAELNPAFLTPPPGLKIVDLAFLPANPTPTEPTSWGRLKRLYR